MPAGRPPKITPKLIDQISEALVFGFTDDEIGTLVDLTSRTIRSIRAGDLFPAIKKAELGRKAEYIRRISEGTRPDWPRWAWMLERRWPAQFAKPEIQLNVNNDNRSVHQTLIISAEVAGQISDRVKVAKTKYQQLLKDKRPHSNGSIPTD